MKNVKVKLLFSISLLGILLIISTPLVSSVFVNLISPTETVPLSSSATVFVDPESFIRDYEDFPVGSTFTVHVNVSDVTDLFTWQLNMSWDSSILNVSSLTAGEFLLRTASVNKTASFQIGSVINATDNVMGYSGMAESILGDVPGIPGPASGRLVSIEFIVVGYGCCDLTINVGGTLSMTLLNSTGDTIVYNKIDGYFRDKLPGDIDIDKDVDYADFIAFADSYLKTKGQPGYNSEADMELDGDVDYADFITFADHYLKIVDP